MVCVRDCRKNKREQNGDDFEAVRRTLLYKNSHVRKTIGRPSPQNDMKILQFPSKWSATWRSYFTGYVGITMYFQWSYFVVKVDCTFLMHICKRIPLSVRIIGSSYNSCLPLCVCFSLCCPSSLPSEILYGGNCSFLELLKQLSLRLIILVCLS